MLFCLASTLIVLPYLEGKYCEKILLKNIQIYLIIELEVIYLSLAIFRRKIIL
jgi:hypothetical protein